MQRLLEIQNLHTHFITQEGIVRAVDGISFDIFRGETVGIVGESGSGKSVTALSLMQLIDQPGRIVEGSIRFFPTEGEAQNLLELSDEQMRQYRGNRMGMIFQEPMTSLNPVFRCGQQVVEAIQVHQKINTAQAKQQTLELFRRVELSDPERIYRAYPHQLSGGQKQRVMIAMALCNKPDLLIADEPTTALDVTVQKAILDLMNELKREFNGSVLFITHDLGVIAELADRVLVMYQGQIVEQGTVEQIFNTPQHPYTKGLLACRPPLHQRLRRLPTVRDFLEAEGAQNSGEQNVSIEEVLTSASIRPQETAQRLIQLQSQEPLLSVQNLQVWFPDQRTFFGKTVSYTKAVDEVSFFVYPGETLGLVGESGCGKTTLGRSILRLVPARGGKVAFEGKEILHLSNQEFRPLRKDLQIIFQDPFSSLNPRKMVGEAILEPMRVHNILANDKERKERVLELLQTVSLEAKHFHRYPHEFSGGQRQRICIARALALNPKFLICDECVSALDVSVQAQVLNLLKDLQEQFQLTYLFISHDLSVVKFMSDRMLVMKSGKIVESGSADEIYEQPKTAYTQQLIAAIPGQ